MPNILSHDGVTLHVDDIGEGPAMLFVHGNNLDSACWEYFVTAFAEAGFRCISYDKRGFGRSERTLRGFSYDALADDLAAVFEALDLRDVTLVGHSMGCAEISRYIARHGDARIARCVFLGTVTPFTVQSNANPEGVPAAALQEVLDGTVADRPALFDALVDDFLAPGTSPATRAYVLDLALRPPLPSAIACASLGMRPDVDLRDDLAKITKPLLVLHGDRDAFCPVNSTAALTARLAPHGELAIYEGAGHGLIFSVKERVRADIERFIAPAETGRRYDAAG